MLFKIYADLLFLLINRYFLIVVFYSFVSLMIFMIPPFSLYVFQTLNAWGLL